MTTLHFRDSPKLKTKTQFVICNFVTFAPFSDVYITPVCKKMAKSIIY